MVYLNSMSVFLPLMQQQASQLLSDLTNASLQLQRVILKIFYALIEVKTVYNCYWCGMYVPCNVVIVVSLCVQYHLPLSLLDEKTIPGWMQIFHSVIDRSEPKVSEHVSP